MVMQSQLMQPRIIPLNSPRLDKILEEGVKTIKIPPPRHNKPKANAIKLKLNIEAKEWDTNINFKRNKCHNIMLDAYELLQL